MNLRTSEDNGEAFSIMFSELISSNWWDLPMQKKEILNLRKDNEVSNG